MRQLSEQELESINARLQSLHIRYTEVYEEVFDHYCTMLENSSQRDTQSIIEKLNDTFAWSMVKQMEKTRIKSTHQNINQSQLESLKIWRLNSHSIVIMISILFILVASYFLFGTIAIILCAQLIGFAGIAISVIKFRSQLNFSLNPKSESSANSFCIAIIYRYIPFNILLTYGYLGISKMDLNTSSIFLSLSHLILVLFIIYGLSLLKVTFEYKSTSAILLKNY